MTTATKNETATTDAPEAKEPEAKVDPLANVDEFGKQAIAKLTALITEYNSLAKVVKAAEGDASGMLAEFRDNYTDDDTVNQIRDKITELEDALEKLHAKRDELLKPIVDAEAAKAKEGLGDKPEKLAEMGKKVNASRKYIEIEYGPDVLATLPALEGKTRAGSGGGATGNRRIRGFDVYVTPDGGTEVKATSRDQKGNESSNLAAVSLLMKKEPFSTKVESEDLRKAFWEAAGTDDSSKYPNTVEFKIPYGPDDAPKFANIRCVRVSNDDSAA